MQKLGDVVILMNRGDVQYLVGGDRLEIKPFPVYSEIAIMFLDELSRTLRSDKESKEYPDILTFAFWCRKANLMKLKGEFQSQFPRIGKGLLFHIAPSNVPINFAYSLAFGILAGNGNVVRVSEKNFPQINVVCRVLNRLLERQEFNLIKAQTQIVSYGHVREINDYYSRLCNMRIIWGGDATIEELRQSPIGPRTTELTFADRYSFALFDERYMESLSDENWKIVGERFYNDTYLMDQNACSSPHFILWKASNERKGRKQFWRAVHQVATKYDLSEKKVVDKYTLACEMTIQMGQIQSIQKYTNLLYVVELADIPERLEDVRGKFGLFYETDLKDVKELCKKMTPKIQTCVTYGIDNHEFEGVLFENNVMGIDRIVSLGEAMDIGVHWDGYDVIGNMSREIVSSY